MLQSSIYSLIYAKVFKKSFERDHKFTPELFEFLLNSSHKVFKNAPRKTFLRIYRISYLIFGGVTLAVILDTTQFFLSLLFFFFCMIIISVAITGSKNNTLENYMKLKEKTKSLIIDSLKNLLYIKSRGWEEHYLKMVAKQRAQEQKSVRKINIVESLWEITSWTAIFLILTILVLLDLEQDMESEHGMTREKIAIRKLVNFIVFYYVMLKMSWLLRHGLDFHKDNVEKEMFYEEMENYFEGMVVQVRPERELTGVDGLDQAPKTMAVMMKDCYFEWRSLGAAKFNQKRDKKKEEEERLYINFNWKKRKERYLKKIEKMNKIAELDVDEEKSVAYTLNTVADGKQQIFDPDNDPLNPHSMKLSEPEYVLKKINLMIRKGQFCFILGTSSSGKSSLFKAIIGEMLISFREKPLFKIKGNLHYIGSSPWLFDGSLKENIIVHNKFNQRRFNDALKFSLLKGTLSAEGYDGRMDPEGVLTINPTEVPLSDDPLFALKIECARCIYSE
jgi:ABC-type multidrug transport system fused ATPase/permease subunit